MRLKSFVLIVKEDKYLLIQEANEKWKGKWFLPGGGVKDNETPEMGAVREVKEEAGCEIELESVFFVKYHRGFFNKKVTIYYCGKITGGQIKTIPDEHSLAVNWFTYADINQLPSRKNLRELIAIYRSHTNFMAVKDFKLNED